MRNRVVYYGLELVPYVPVILEFEPGKNGLLTVAELGIVAALVVVVFAVKIAGAQIGGCKSTAFYAVVLKQIRHVYFAYKPETYQVIHVNGSTYIIDAEADVVIIRPGNLQNFGGVRGYRIFGRCAGSWFGGWFWRFLRCAVFVAELVILHVDRFFAFGLFRDNFATCGIC